MSGGMFSRGLAGGPVSEFLSSTARPAVAASTQARIAQFVVAKPMASVPAPSVLPDDDADDAPRSPVFGGDESMDAPTADVPSTDPWAGQDAAPASKPHKHRGMRKSAIAAAAMEVQLAQQEAWSDSESDDNDFAPGDDKDRDGDDGSDSDSGSGSDGSDNDAGSGSDGSDNDAGSGSNDDGDQLPAPRKKHTVRVVVNKKDPRRKHAADASSSSAAAAVNKKNRNKELSPKPKAKRQSKNEMLRELELKLFGRATDDEDEGEGDWIVDDDDGDEDEDDDEHSSDYDDIVRDDADRLQDALSFKTSVVVSKSNPEQALLASGNDLNALMANYSKERDRAAFNKLMEGMAHAGFDVNAEAPPIPEEEFERRAKKASDDAAVASVAAAVVSDPESMDDDDNDDDDDSGNAVPEPEESPIHTLVPELIMALEKDEIDLPEQTAKLCQLVFNKVLLFCRSTPTGASIDLGKELHSVWGTPASSSQFYGRCRRMIAFIMNKTRARFNSYLITAFAGAFNSASLCEFVPAKFVINETHDRHKLPYRCASCARNMPRHPMPGSVGLHYLPGIELFQHKQVPITRPTGTLHATSPLLSRPQSNTDTTKQFLLCATCAPVMPIMNQLLTAGHDIAYLSRAWIEEHRDSVYVSADGQAALSDAFHQDARRQKLCQSIIWAYKMMHAVALT